jgi:hypothetical protein
MWKTFKKLLNVLMIAGTFYLICWMAVLLFEQIMRVAR